MEVSSHALALGRADDCDWDGALFTNLTRDHLDFHPDMETYFAAKRRLFTELLPRLSKRDHFAAVNCDDPYGRRLIDATGGRVVTFGRGDNADVAPLEVSRSLAGLRGEIRIRDQRLVIESTLVGEAHLEDDTAPMLNPRPFDRTAGQGRLDELSAVGVLPRQSGLDPRVENLDRPPLSHTCQGKPAHRRWPFALGLTRW